MKILIIIIVLIGLMDIFIVIGGTKMDLDDEELEATKRRNGLQKYVKKEKIRQILEEYAKVDLENYGKVLEFYQKLKKVVEE